MEPIKARIAEAQLSVFGESRLVLLIERIGINESHELERAVATGEFVLISRMGTKEAERTK